MFYRLGMTDKPARRIDARSLRGLAHPLRMTILELLTLDGPATATGLAARVGENTGTVSWHLRHLAEHGFIEEETGRGTRRERWWRVVDERRTLDTAEFRDDPDTRGALSVYLHEVVQQQFARVTRYLTEEWTGPWQGAGTVSSRQDLRLTADQLRALNAELLAVIERHARQEAGSDALPDALPVVVQLQSFPRRRGDGT